MEQKEVYQALTERMGVPDSKLMALRLKRSDGHNLFEL
jgi:hypothetical protein